MIKIENVENKKLKEALITLNTKKDVLLISIDEKPSPKQILKRITDYFITFPEGQVIILSKINYIKSKGSLEKNDKVNLIENAGKVFKKKNKKVNTVR